MAGPLSHVRVLDLSRIMAGPWATQILADLGADVIKVERPDVGDDTRSWGPPFVEGEGGEKLASGYFLSVNRGKRSIALDMSRAEDQAVIRDLARSSDIVVENFKVGALARYGLGYDDLRKINPGLIYASVTGFGQTGPRREQSAYDFMVQAMGGLMSVTGERDDKPGGGPQKVGVPIVDLMTGMYTAVAVLAALNHRERTGKGEYIDIGMLDVQTAFLANQAQNFLLSGREPQRSGNSHPNIQPQDVFAVRDGQFRAFCQAIGHPDLADDVRFSRNAERVRNLPDLSEIIREALIREDLAVWLARLDALGVPCGPINTISSVFADPQVEERGLLQTLDHPRMGPIKLVTSPMRFHQAPLRFDRPPPLLGEHTDEILEEFGLRVSQSGAGGQL